MSQLAILPPKGRGSRMLFSRNVVYISLSYTIFLEIHVLSAVSRWAQSATKAVTSVWYSSYTLVFTQFWLCNWHSDLHNTWCTGDNTFCLRPGSKSLSSHFYKEIIELEQWNCILTEYVCNIYQITAVTYITVCNVYRFIPNCYYWMQQTHHKHIERHNYINNLL